MWRLCRFVRGMGAVELCGGAWWWGGYMYGGGGSQGAEVMVCSAWIAGLSTGLESQLDNGRKRYQFPTPNALATKEI